MDKASRAKTHSMTQQILTIKSQKHIYWTFSTLYTLLQTLSKYYLSISLHIFENAHYYGPPQYMQLGERRRRPDRDAFLFSSMMLFFSDSNANRAVGVYCDIAEVTAIILLSFLNFRHPPLKLG